MEDINLSFIHGNKKSCNVTWNRVTLQLFLWFSELILFKQFIIWQGFNLFLYLNELLFKY